MAEQEVMHKLFFAVSIATPRCDLARTKSE